MKKAIKEWAFNLFTKRITVKIANLPNDARIEYLVNKLMNELVAQGHELKGGNSTEFLNIFGFEDGTIHIDSNGFKRLLFKRLMKV